ncbi:NAD(P)H-hydrate dehydratase [Streptococcus suis]|uniref:NAD(P)H-hydrate dehydratase n=1 Tax=Streptococcus suis TaxID=1307 RepID=UPI000CF3F61D|nr:NAD(P)H-hydrate dehydratase [Streptococcus suis]
MDLQELCRQVIQARPMDSHKGTFGRALLIGGLYPYGGAIIMAALATVNSGAGLVTVATEKENIPALHSHLPEAMAFSVEDNDLLVTNLKHADLVLIGPGLGDNSRAENLVDLVLEHLSEKQILVIDGSALTIIAKQNQKHFPCKQAILTPHQKEWERLSTIPIAKQTSQTNLLALQTFQEHTILVAKSSATQVLQATPEQITPIKAGGPYQATGGMGDTLAGMIAGFALQFQHVQLYDRVVTATYLHSHIADQLAQQLYLVKPTDISKEIQKSMYQFQMQKAPS